MIGEWNSETTEGKKFTEWIGLYGGNNMVITLSARTRGGPPHHGALDRHRRGISDRKPALSPPATGTRSVSAFPKAATRRRRSR